MSEAHEWDRYPYRLHEHTVRRLVVRPGARPPVGNGPYWAFVVMVLVVLPPLAQVLTGWAWLMAILLVVLVVAILCCWR